MAELIRYSREIRDKPKELISEKRLREIYSEEEYKDFDSFVRTVYKDGLIRFCVSHGLDPKRRDPELRFYEIVPGVDGKSLQIIFLGQMMGKGSIEITNAYAAETHGYRVLQLEEKQRK